MIRGDMGADRADDIYPIVQLCDECIENDTQLEEPQIIQVYDYDPYHGDTCAFCENESDDFL